jgi:plasmid stabilization system protein ParE
VLPIRISAQAVRDLERIERHLADFAVPDISGRIEEIFAALDILGHSPLIGRKVQPGRRELIIGRGSLGYVALYRFAQAERHVMILAIRSQREDGYKRATP